MLSMPKHQVQAITRRRNQAPPGQRHHGQTRAANTYMQAPTATRHPCSAAVTGRRQPMRSSRRQEQLSPPQLHSGFTTGRNN